MKKIFLVFVLLFFPVLGVSASSISNIDMDIFVEEDGDAIVTEKWMANVTEGTEGWHPYYNLGNSEISNLLVSMDGKEYTTISDWDIDNSFSDKAYKAGFYYPSSDEVDICFGISSYGEHEYIIQYQISNFVSTLDDADMIYWNLFPYDFSAEPDSVNITIYSDFLYDDNIELYGYGKYGAYNQLNNGKIVIDSMGSVDKDEYLTILVKFPKGTFQTNNILDNDFEFYYNMAEEGAINYNDNSNSLGAKIISFLGAFFSIFINVFVWGFILFFSIFTSKKNNNISFGSVGNKVRKDVPNFRDIPCNKDIYRAYWVATNYKLTKKKEDFLGAVLLKWLRNGNIRIEKVVKDGFFKDKVNDNVIFLKRPDDSISLEGDLYDHMFEASLDGKLESDEFKKWCSKNYREILKWFDDVLEFENKMLVNEGKATVSTVTSLKIFKYDTYQIDASMMQEAEQMAGLKKYLKEFTLIKEREPIEVSLWNEYLIYAQIFGMADEVASQFKKLYPEVITDMDSMGYTYDDILFIHMISYNGIKSANAAQGSANSYSSSGGGGGSFGGGGGGGGFR